MNLYRNLMFYVAFIASSICQGATITWDGGGDGQKWSDPLNWSCNCLPSPNDLVEISNALVLIAPGNQVIISTLEMYNNSILNISIGAHISLINIYSNSSTINNEGTILASKQYINEDGAHVNNSSGIITINVHPFDVSNINSLVNDGTFTNDGLINIFESSKTALYSYVNSGPLPTFVNNGEICISSYKTSGIETNGQFINTGNIKVTDAIQTAVNIYGNWENQTGSKIEIAEVESRGIYVVDSFSNHGQIVQNNVDIAIDLSNPSGKNYIINKVGSLIKLTSVDQAIFSVGGEFYNHGSIEMYDASMNIRLLSTTSLNPSKFENYSELIMQGISTLSILNSGFSTFINEACAILEVNAEVRNFNTFTNNGFIKQSSSSSSFLNNQGTFINNGIIEDTDSSFTSMVSTNNGYTLSRISGMNDVADVINNVLSGTGTGITIQNNNFVPSLEVSNQSAGLYTGGANTWTIACNAFGRDEIFIPFDLGSCPVELMKITLENSIGLKTGILNSWQGNVNNSWTNAANWSLGTVPQGCEHVNIPSGHTINIDKNGLARSINLGSGSTLNLLSGFNLDLYGSNFGGIRVDGGTLNVAGIISIQHTALEGMRNENSGSVLITSAGEIRIENLDLQNAHGILNQTSSTFVNNGKLLFDMTFGAQNETIQNEAILTNGTTGEICMDLDLINRNSNAQLFNQGVIHNLRNIWNENNAALFNEACAELSLTGQLDNASSFVNLGFICQSFNGLNENTGTIENSGVIDDEYGSFDELINSNSGYYIAKVQNQFEVDFGATYFLNGAGQNLSVDGLYLDSLLCFSAGHFDPVLNTWIPDSSSLGRERFFLEVEQNGTCKDTFSITLKNLVVEDFCPSGTSIVSPLSNITAKNWEDPTTWNLGMIPDYCSDVSLIDPSSGPIVIDSTIVARCNTILTVGRVLDLKLGGVLDATARK